VYTARKLRKSLSPAEAKLWHQLRGSPGGIKFRLQHPIDPYVADFYCAAAKLIIEVDGTAHDGAGALRDERRDAALRAQGYEIMRISAADVMRDVGSVFAHIMGRVAIPLHQPSAGPPPRSGEDSRSPPSCPFRNGEGDHAKRGGGGSEPPQRPITNTPPPHLREAN
jgi:very-short-patch-repair endonuclease